MKNLKLLLTIFALIATLALTSLLASCGGTNDTTTTEGTTTIAETTKNPVLVTAYDKPEEHVTLPALNEITVSNADVQKDIDAYLDDILSDLGKDDFRNVADGTTAIVGDSLNIHFTGRAKDPSVTLTEQTLAGMTNASDTAGYDLILGSDAFIPGFEEQLVGAKKGDTVTVDVTFPDGYSAELSNLAVIFEVTVNSISRATVSAENSVVLSVLYTLKDVEETTESASLLTVHETTLDLTDTEALFDFYFDSAAVREALIGKTLYEVAEVDVVLPAETAKDFGYDKDVTLSAKITVKQVVYYPTELTDADVESYTGGDYKTVADLTEYITNYYKGAWAYEAVMDKAEYNVEKEVYDILYQSYYDSYVLNYVGDLSGMTEEEIAEIFTEEKKKSADTYATENATNEYQDRMLMAYLCQKLNFTLTEEAYEESLTEMYNYYTVYYYYEMLYSGIVTKDDFEAYFGEDYLRYQFTVDEVIMLLGETITFVD